MSIGTAPIPDGPQGRGRRWGKYTKALLDTKGESAIIIDDVPHAERHDLVVALRTHPDIRPYWFVRTNGRYGSPCLVWMTKR